MECEGIQGLINSSLGMKIGDEKEEWRGVDDNGEEGLSIKGR